MADHNTNSRLRDLLEQELHISKEKVIDNILFDERRMELVESFCVYSERLHTLLSASLDLDNHNDTLRKDITEMEDTIRKKRQEIAKEELLQKSKETEFNSLKGIHRGFVQQKNDLAQLESNIRIRFVTAKENVNRIQNEIDMLKEGIEVIQKEIREGEYRLASFSKEQEDLETEYAELQINSKALEEEISRIRLVSTEYFEHKNNLEMRKLSALEAYAALREEKERVTKEKKEHQMVCDTLLKEISAVENEAQGVARQLHHYANAHTTMIENSSLSTTQPVVGEYQSTVKSTSSGASRSGNNSVGSVIPFTPIADTPQTVKSTNTPLTVSKDMAPNDLDTFPVFERYYHPSLQKGAFQTKLGRSVSAIRARLVAEQFVPTSSLDEDDDGLIFEENKSLGKRPRGNLKGSGVAKVQKSERRTKVGKGTDKRKQSDSNYTYGGASGEECDLFSDNIWIS